MTSDEKFKAHVDRAILSLPDVGTKLGDDGINKATAIYYLLKIGDKPSVAYSKAILAAVDLLIERASTFFEPADD